MAAGTLYNLFSIQPWALEEEGGERERSKEKKNKTALISGIHQMVL